MVDAPVSIIDTTPCRVIASQAQEPKNGEELHHLEVVLRPDQIDLIAERVVALLAKVKDGQ